MSPTTSPIGHLWGRLGEQRGGHRRAGVTFPAVSVAAGDFFYLASQAPGFTTFFGFAPDFTDASALSINGDDAVELFMNGAVVDVFGEATYTGARLWTYEDGWAIGPTAPLRTPCSPSPTGHQRHQRARRCGNQCHGDHTLPLGTYTEDAAPPPLPNSVIMNEVDSDMPLRRCRVRRALRRRNRRHLLDGFALVFDNGSNDLSYGGGSRRPDHRRRRDVVVCGDVMPHSRQRRSRFGRGIQNGQDAVALYAADGADFP